MLRERKVSEFQPVMILRLSLPAATLFSLLVTLNLQGLVPWLDPMIALAGGHDDAVFFALAVFVPGVVVSSSQAYLYCIARPWCGRWFMALGFFNLLAAIICAGILSISLIWYLDRTLHANYRAMF